MLKAINLTKTKVYESDLDDAKGTDQATQFVLGAINTRAFSSIVDRNSEIRVNEDGEQASRFNSMTVAYDLVRFGLKDINNMQDADGNPLKFVTESVNYNGKTMLAASSAIMEALPTELIVELAGEIQSLNSVTAEEAKN